MSKCQKGAYDYWITTAQTGRRRKRGRSKGGREKEENSGGRKSGEPTSCVCVRARFPTAMLFFAVTSVTLAMEKG